MVEMSLNGNTMTFYGISAPKIYLRLGDKGDLAISNKQMETISPQYELDLDESGKVTNLSKILLEILKGDGYEGHHSFLYLESIDRYLCQK